MSQERDAYTLALFRSASIRAQELSIFSFIVHGKQIIHDIVEIGFSERPSLCELEAFQFALGAIEDFCLFLQCRMYLALPERLLVCSRRI